jgi:hypothetical protein
MTTAKIIEGLTILEKYRNEPDGYNCGAEHDVLWAYATDKPVEGADLDRLIEMGWAQDRESYEEDFGPQHYNPEESWRAYT